MKLKLFIIAIISSFTMNAYANNCNFKNINTQFGRSIDQMASQYKLDTMGVNKKGETTIPIIAAKVCNELPEKVLLEFIFIDDTFVQLKLNNTNTFNELLSFAKKTFGENDDKDRPESTDGSAMALWNKDDKYSIIYSARAEEREYLSEVLQITTNGYKWLFDKSIKEQN